MLVKTLPRPKLRLRAVINISWKAFSAKYCDRNKEINAKNIDLWIDTNVITINLFVSSHKTEPLQVKSFSVRSLSSGSEYTRYIWYIWKVCVRQGWCKIIDNILHTTSWNLPLWGKYQMTLRSVHTYRQVNVLVSGTFDLLNIVCKQHHTTTLNPF